ncbi:DUF1464 domain-containing protein [Candidatus Geothermarchaeota archaeon]|nr:MAG: DUF1464 domain-containing protein [Candidatus Geothermarchaeota archaeon]
MCKVIGIDPGTRSFDICGIEDDHVYYEKIIDTIDIAKNPGILLKSIEDLFPLDLIVGPSGYGVPVTYLTNIPFDKVEDWYLTNILLLKKKDLENALKRGDIGIMVYYGMVKSAIEMKKRKWPVCYIPGVIHMPTVPKYRKFNKIDMGTADKLSTAVLGVYDQSREYQIDYSEVSFILLEAGFGYNAAIAVYNGRIVDGVGGTSGGLGFLTIGSMDAELVQLVGIWEKSDIFIGGASTISSKTDPRELEKCIDTDNRCYEAWQALIESNIKNVYSLLPSVNNKPREIILSGRLSRIKRFEEELSTKLSKIAYVRKIGYLNGAKITKEAAQGYAIVACGLAGGYFEDLIDWMKIKEAYGTAIDYVVHPKKELIRELFR